MQQISEAATETTARFEYDRAGGCADTLENGDTLPSPRDAFDGVVTALHEGIFKQPYWTDFLTKIRNLTKAEYASLTFRRADARYQDINVVKSGFSGGPTDLANIYAMIGKSHLPYNSIKPDVPYSLQEILNIDPGGSVDYVRYLRGRCIDYAFVVRVTARDGGNCWLTLGRPKNDFAPGTRSLVAGIAPHLGIAARTLAELERERLRADVAADAVRRLNFGWLTFDAKGRVIDVDLGAESLFRSTPSLQGCRRGQMFPVQRSNCSTLADVLGNFAELRSIKPVAYHLVDDPWLDMLIAPIRYRAVSGGVTPVAVGYVHGVGISSADRCEQLIQLFGLSRSEALLAVALSQGKSIVEAANELRLTTETARNYSKRIYAKTGTRGQSDLVRIILASVIALS